ncbi:adenomatous polyposis coli protein 2 isoform X3 [Canis lupus familiaris]|uniref:adenomatous polyposis coli protein 2 isoform X1 n=2 Tax=Canis lupus dingo TaxID=286419 RepID=UPI0015F17A79|nr:adenomatous polyposis coli protein 2 isoform X1 [Canis lupus dingo]XP_038310916.1 adenomatous polyposis coli protein 2 isoform X3 [Canis lupus familiaris]XP_038423903.1 adenomatous polyposis coli protein 2 isoform X3 [Canis lupus familiaris]
MGLWGLLSLLHSAFFGDQALQELRMASSVAPYEQLVRQVEALKAENSHLRQELRDNSSHLSKLETETSGMKEVLKHLQGKLEQEAGVLVSLGQTEVLEQLKALQMDITSLYNLKFHTPALDPEPTARTPEGSPVHGSGPSKDSFGELGRATIRLLEELDRERCFLLNEIEKEEKEKLWYYSQLQGLSKRLDELPHVETQFSMQMDLIRQQLEFEAQHIRSLMEERFGTSDEMVQRAQIRASRLEQIDQELLSAQDRVQQTEPQALLAAKSVPVDEDPDTEVPTHPEDGVPQPGNSKVEVVFWLLSMLATRDQEDTARTLLAMSSSPESCVAMRRSGCLPLLLQILHGAEAGAGGRNGAPGAPGAKDARMRANAALHNIVFSQPDQGLARKEMRVLHVLEQIRAYCETCWDWLQARDAADGGAGGAPVPIEPQICQATCAVMKLSFDEEYRRAMNELGGLQAVAELLQVDYEMHKMTRDPLNLALRRYAGMTLTNLTFGDVANKATLCARRGCMEAIVAQLASESEELHQVVSSILRNLSWRADINSKKVLREVGSMTALMQCVLRASKESTLKSVLSALWNLSAHSTENKAAICQVDGALGFLVSTLTYKCQSNSLAIIESGGGILRNVSSLIATREDYRQVLRDHNCLQTLLQHLTSHSLTIVSNACGTLWNLSARSPRDQELLWDLGAVGMLRNLVHSKHKMIAMGSAAALRNLLAHRPAKYQITTTAVSPGACAPSLYVRKQRALEAELDTRRLAQALDHLEKQGLPEAEAEADAEAASKKPLPPLRHLDGLARDYASDSGCFDDDEAPSLATAAATAEPASPAVLSLFLGSPFLQGQALARAPPARRGGPEAEKETGGEVAVAARAKAKLALAVARIDRLVEDISALHTSSDDSFSLSSGDPGQEAPREGRAQSCSPCRRPEGRRQEASGRAHPLLRLKAAQASLSNDSLNSGSTGDGRCPREHTRPCPLAVLAEHREGSPCSQARPSRLDLHLPGGKEPASRDSSAADACVRTIKLSPTYQHVPLFEGNPRAAMGSMAPGARKEAWLPAEGLSKVPEKLAAEAVPLCLSRCSSLSSLSSAGRPGPSEAGDLDSDSSLEGLEEAGPSKADLDGAWLGPGAASLPVAIPTPQRGRGLGVEDTTPSSSSENCVQETPLVLSRCSSVSSLSSFESPSIASSVASDPCSGLGSGTVSPSELPDSPGQTMPPSRSKTPPLAPVPPGERESTQFSLQWESYVKRFLDIADRRERCRLPSELDAGSVRFTVEKPDENFSCASSLSALALHEHYVQKDVELRLLPPACPERGGGGGGGGGPGLHFAGHRRRDEAGGCLEGPAAGDQELELLRECLGAAVPARLRKVASALVPGRRALPVPVYMLVPAPARVDDSAEGTPVTFSSATSLSDETLQAPPQEPDRHKPAGREAPPRQATGHRHRAWGTGRSRVGLELPLRRPASACTEQYSGRPSPARGDRGDRGDGALQSLCLTTPTEEAVYCFYDDSDEDPPVAVAPPRRPSAIPRAVKREPPAGRKGVQAAPQPAEAPRVQPSLIADETPPCYSLSSSASSLSEPDPPAHPPARARAPKAAVTKAPGAAGASDGLRSPRAESGPLRRCVGSAVPRRRLQASAPRRRKPQAAQPDRRPAEGPRERDEAAGSDHASDLDSVEWRAIQEGANSIVTWLHQAAAAATPEASSGSDSGPSESGLSGASTLPRKGRRLQAGGQAGQAARPEKRDPAVAQRGTSGPEKLRGAQKPACRVPAVLRGRTVIYMPSAAPRAQPKGAPGTRAALRKMGPPSPAQPAAPANTPSPGQQRSRSLHRPGKISELAALSPPQRSTTPPARLAKAPSSGSSPASPASQPPTRRPPPGPQALGPLPGPGASLVPQTPTRALLSKQHKTQKSPVRIPFMQRPARRGPPPLARAAPEPGPRGRAGAEGSPGARGARLGLVRVASARSSGSESSDRSGFRRQLTFIKESPGLLRRRRSELSTPEAATPAAQGGSPRRGRPALPAVFLCSSRCDELRAAPRQVPVPEPTPAARPAPGERPARRPSSESPSRLPVRTPAARPETVKRYASLPHISVARRPDAAPPGPAADAARRSSDGEARPLPRVAAPGTTWRRIRDEDVPHILRSTLPATALPLMGAPPEEGPGGPPQRKTSDAVVQTEDFAATKTNSSTSPSLESRGPPQAPVSGPTALLGSDVDGPGPTKAPTSVPFIHEGLGVAAGGFPASRHGSPSRSARVPPFNYVPSPMVSATTDLAAEKAPTAAPASLLE